MNIIASIEGKVRKIFRLKGKDITSDFKIGSRLRLIESIPNEEMSLERIKLGIQKAREHSGFILPALPNNGQSDEFKISKRGLKDAPRRFFVADVDSRVTDDLLALDLRSRANDWIHSEGLPSNTGYVAIWSSSAFLKTNNKRSIHIYFLLADAHKQDELRELTEGLDCDHRMCEKTRVHCVLPPHFDERFMRAEEYHRYDEIVIQNGEPLDLRKISRQPRPNPKIADIEEYQHQSDKRASFNVFKALKDHFLAQGEKPPWQDPKRIAKACEELLSKGQIEHRHMIHYLLMKQGYERSGDTYDYMAEILNSRTLLGKHKPRELIDQADKIKRDFLEQTTGGKLESIFSQDETVRVSLDSAQGITEDQLDFLFPENAITAMDVFEGFGKSHLIIRPMLDKFDPETVLSTCHRWNILKTQSKNFDLEYGADIGKDNPAFEKLTIQERKTHFWPDSKNPAITIQSLQYVARNGAVNDYRIILIDEIEHVLNEVWLEPSLRTAPSYFDQHHKQFHTLLTLCVQANQVWVADASASTLTRWFIQELANFSGKKKRLLTNETDYVERMTFRDIPRLEDAILTAIELIKEGKKIAVFTDHADKAQHGKMERILLPIKKLAKLEDHEIFGMTAESAKSGTGKAIVEDASKIGEMIDNGLKCFLASPVFDSGFSYHEDGNRKFDAVIVILDHGLTNADAIKQAIRRYRLTTDVYTYIKRRFNRKAA